MARAQSKSTARPKSSNLVRLHRDRGYRFTDRDPVMEEVCVIITESAKSAGEISQLTAKSTGGALKVAPQTITNWLTGKTRRPQNYTLTWVLFVLGYTRKIVKN